MLQIVIPKTEMFDEIKQEFVDVPEQVLHLEHSLVSLSKWESKWHKPFLSRTTEKSYEELIDYVRCMTITQNVKPEVYYGLTMGNLDVIQKYIDDPMTAAKFSEKVNEKYSSEFISAETVYYWMIMFGIPIDCQKWHLNRLLALIRFCDVKSRPKNSKNTNKKAIADRYSRINAERRRRFNSKG